jgi:signal transduction histidine kinase
MHLALYSLVAFPISASAESEKATAAASAPPGKSRLDPKYGVGSWIWASETHDEQLCRFWREFDIPRHSIVVNARLRITVDNSYRLFLDGRELGRGGEWRSLTEHDLTQLLNPGAHTLAVEAFNDYLEAGVLAGLIIHLADGRTIEIASDPSWRVVPLTESGWLTKTEPGRDWPAATVVGAFLQAPWDQEPSKIIMAPLVLPITLRFWQEGWFQILLLSFCALAAAMFLQLMGKLAVQSRAQEVVQRERARIARDIHDDLTAGLTQLVLMGEVAQSALPAGSEPRRLVDKVCEKARGLSLSMNEIIWVVNSQRDTLRSFVSYACKYAKTFLQPTSIRCRFNNEEEMPDLPCDMGVRRNLFLAVKEALNNAARHSGADELVLGIHRQGKSIVLIIEDDGKGFDPALADGERNGLSNMMKRATEAGGVCRVSSQPGNGCRVEFVVPLARATPLHTNWPPGFWKRRAPSQTPPQAPPAVSSSPVHPSNSTL